MCVRACVCVCVCGWVGGWVRVCVCLYAFTVEASFVCEDVLDLHASTYLIARINDLVLWALYIIMFPPRFFISVSESLFQFLFHFRLQRRNSSKTTNSRENAMI